MFWSVERCRPHCDRRLRGKYLYPPFDSRLERALTDCVVYSYAVCAIMSLNVRQFVNNRCTCSTYKYCISRLEFRFAFDDAVLLSCAATLGDSHFTTHLSCTARRPTRRLGRRRRRRIFRALDFPLPLTPCTQGTDSLPYVLEPGKHSSGCSRLSRTRSVFRPPRRDIGRAAGLCGACGSPRRPRRTGGTTRSSQHPERHP
jgi:hypothetical protein